MEDKLLKTLMLYCIEKKISLSKVSQLMVDNPFPIGVSNIYKFYLQKQDLSAKQRTKLILFFELQNYTK